ncbi:MAG TPA: rod shape-determining protein MreC [Candidatus Humimicrobiaceae bacterium]|nr:rod shape-determining protein MreC [Candidatus Humimicrobiaceae bacterium]
MKLRYKIKIAIISVLLLVFFLVLNLTFFGKEVKNSFYLISSPIQNIFWGAGVRVSGFFEFIIEMKHLKEENEKLKLQVQDLLAENEVLKDFKEENEKLREALGIGLEKEFQLVLARVTGRDIAQDFISINKGTQDGIPEGSHFPVITQEKVLIGRIDKVYKNFSKVLLISHSQGSFVGKIADSEILGTVKGRGNLKVGLERISREEEIKEGDLVVTSALSGVFPPGLLIGKVGQIEKADPEPFYRAELSPFFDIGELEKVFIIINH